MTSWSIDCRCPERLRMSRTRRAASPGRIVCGTQVTYAIACNWREMRGSLTWQPLSPCAVRWRPSGQAGTPRGLFRSPAPVAARRDPRNRRPPGRPGLSMPRGARAGCSGDTVAKAHAFRAFQACVSSRSGAPDRQTGVDKPSSIVVQPGPAHPILSTRGQRKGRAMPAQAGTRLIKDSSKIPFF